MADQRNDAISRAQQDMVSRMSDAARALTDLNPLLRGRRPEDVLDVIQHVFQGIGGYGALAIEPFTEFIERQRELADRMAAWAELQREFADHMAAWAALQRRLADSFDLWLRPLAEGGRRLSDLLGGPPERGPSRGAKKKTAKKTAAKPTRKAPAKPAKKGAAKKSG